MARGLPVWVIAGETSARAETVLVPAKGISVGYGGGTKRYWTRGPKAARFSMVLSAWDCSRPR
jgi:hypothetical protein